MTTPTALAGTFARVKSPLAPTVAVIVPSSTVGFAKPKLPNAGGPIGLPPYVKTTVAPAAGAPAAYTKPVTSTNGAR